MSSTTVHARTTVRPFTGLATRVGHFVTTRRSRRDMRAVLSGHHGSAMRDEILARL